MQGKNKEMWKEGGKLGRVGGREGVDDGLGYDGRGLKKWKERGGRKAVEQTCVGGVALGCVRR